MLCRKCTLLNNIKRMYDSSACRFNQHARCYNNEPSSKDTTELARYDMSLIAIHLLFFETPPLPRFSFVLAAAAAVTAALYWEPDSFRERSVAVLFELLLPLPVAEAVPTDCNIVQQITSNTQ